MPEATMPLRQASDDSSNAADMTVTVLIPRAQPPAPRRVETGGGMFEADDHNRHDYGEVLHTSLHASVTPSHHGLVHAAFRAFHANQHLSVRPEDVWLGVIAQVAVYLCAHPAVRRGILDDGWDDTIRCANPGARLASQMIDHLDNNSSDAALAGWVMPNFSTTTRADRAVAAALFLGTMRGPLATSDGSRRRGGSGEQSSSPAAPPRSIMAALFAGPMREARDLARGGLSAITLQGKAADYEDIFQRLDRLHRHLGASSELERLTELLRPVVQYMVLTFFEQGTPRVLSFWEHMIQADPWRTGKTYLSGWITAFCCLSAKDGLPQSYARPEYCLHGVGYPSVHVLCTPPGTAVLPVVMDDDDDGLVECTVVAGSMAIRAREPTLVDEFIQPVPGWTIYLNKT